MDNIVRCALCTNTSFDKIEQLSHLGYTYCSDCLNDRCEFTVTEVYTLQGFYFKFYGFSKLDIPIKIVELVDTDTFAVLRKYPIRADTSVDTVIQEWFNRGL